MSHRAHLDNEFIQVGQALERLAPGALLKDELEGGASTRRFFRVEVEGKPAILMFAPAPSQEVAKARQSSGNGSFLAMREVLAAQGIPVPKILSAEDDQCVLVEDLGRFTLAAYLQEQPQERQRLYKNAIECLAKARVAFETAGAEAPFRARAFDQELLLWEVEHFRRWVFEEQGLRLSETENKVFSDAAQLLASKISELPRGFVHRDYQSRNLMVRPESQAQPLVWIDFQDAMSGPRAYDLVALLTDSYQVFERPFVLKRLQDYLKETRGTVKEAELQELCYEFDLISVQRKLKDAGRFIFTDRVNHNPHFLRYVDLTIERALAALSQLEAEPKFKALALLIQQKLKELKELQQ